MRPINGALLIGGSTFEAFVHSSMHVVSPPLLANAIDFALRLPLEILTTCFAGAVYYDWRIRYDAYDPQRRVDALGLAEN